MALLLNISWHRYITLIATSAAKKLEFLFRVRKYFSSSNLYTLYVFQIRPCLEYGSHVWGAAPPSTLSILDFIQKKAIRLIDDPVLAERLPSLAHRRAVCLFYRYFHRFCSEELASTIPPLAVRDRVTRGVVHMHPYTVQLQKPRTSHYLRFFIPRVSRLWNLLPADVLPSSLNLQSFKSLINRLHLTSPQTLMVHSPLGLESSWAVEDIKKVTHTYIGRRAF